MKKAFFTTLLLAFAASASAYQINHGYPAPEGTEYYGTCDDGTDFVLYEQTGQRFAYQSPIATGETSGEEGFDRAARAACGE